MGEPIIIGGKIKKGIKDFYGFPIPIGGGVMVAGPEKSGKSSWVISVAAILARRTGRHVLFMNEEVQDVEYIQNIFGRFVDPSQLVVVNKPLRESKREVAEWVGERGAIFVLDSAAAVVGEREGESKSYGSGNFGERAKIINDALRDVSRRSAMSGAPFFIVNHLYPSVGGYSKVTPGGVGKDYFVEVSATLSVAYGLVKSGWVIWEDGDKRVWVVKCMVSKSRYTPAGSEYSFVLEGGEGISIEKTAIFRAVESGILKYNNGRVYKADKSLGLLSEIMLSDVRELDELLSMQEISTLLEKEVHSEGEK